MLWRWVKGRQQTGYDKLLIATGKYPLPFDAYLLRYREGTYIPPHQDPVDNARHYRLNVILKNSAMGGEFICNKVIWSTSRIKLFRSDISIHSVSRVDKGTRYVLRIGWLRKP